MLLKEIKIIFRKELNAIYPKEEVDNFFYMFMEHYLGLERFALVLQPNYVVTKEEEQPFFEGLTRLKNEEPIQYILGEAHFMDLKFKVNMDVLIPRPETEELVRWIISNCQVERSRDLKILDIGTGSGCIAIALAKSLSKARVFANDISKKALKLSEQNAKSNNVRIEFIQADILDENTGFGLEFDLIVSNPPYVREMEKVKMSRNVTAFEPEGALYVPDENPLIFYRAIADFSQKHLSKNGTLFLEINQYLAKETQQLLVDNQFGEVELRKDIFGNFRMLKAVWPGN